MSQPVRYNAGFKYNSPGSVYNGMAEDNNMDNTDIKTASLSADDIAAIKAAFTAALAKLTFVQTLSNHDRLGLVKVRDERLAFVENALAAAQNNGNILPSTFDTANFASRLALFQTVNDLDTVAQQTARKFEDTHMVLGDILMSYAEDVKKYVDTAAKKTPGLQPLSAQLGALYQKAVATRRANERKKAEAAAKK